MVQVDVFWSYGIGAGFAVAAARQLRLRRDLIERGDATAAEFAAAGEAVAGERAPRRKPGRASTVWADFTELLQNRHMVKTILYAALLFAPSGVYLVWGFPEWETMQAGTRAMPAWLIALFAITNVTQAILAFWVTERLITRGRQYLGLLQAWAGYFGMFFILVNGWDKTGWQRFFSENRADFEAWDAEPALDQVTGWLTSNVALTLYAMGAVLIPVMAWIMVGAIRSGYRTGGDYSPFRRPVGTALLVASTTAMLLSGVPAAIVAHLLIVEFGWIAGSAVAAAIIYFGLLDHRTGLLRFGYRLLALEDAASERLRSGGRGPGAVSRARTARTVPAPGHELG